MNGNMIRKLRMFDMSFWDVTLEQALAAIVSLGDEADGSVFPYVLTANTDILLVLDRKRETAPGFYRAMSDAPIILADGFPVVMASRLFGGPLRQRVTGADLFPALLHATSQRRYLMIGPDRNTMDALQQRVEQETENSLRSFVAPRMSIGDAAYRQFLTHMLEETVAYRPDYVICFVGFPKAEHFLLELFEGLRQKHNPPVPVFLSLGAAASFYAGTRRRAPVWVQRSGFEWLHRLLQEPGRLLGRYTKGAVLFPLLTYRYWKHGRHGR